MKRDELFQGWGRFRKFLNVPKKAFLTSICGVYTLCCATGMSRRSRDKG